MSHLNDQLFSKYNNPDAKFSTIDKGKNCEIKTSEREAEKPLKYITQDFHEKTPQQARGIFFNDGYGVPRTDIGSSTKLRYGAITHENVSYSLGQLPLPTTAGLEHGRGQGNTDIEDRLRVGMDDHVFKSQQPSGGNQFYLRHFYQFGSLPVEPNQCVKNYVPVNNGFRQGVSTRDLNHTEKR